MPKNPLILLADDSKADCKVIEIALKRLESPFTLKTVGDGEQLMQALKSKAKRPDLILLDLNMPVKNGFEALREIQGEESLRDIPIVIWSTSSSLADITTAYRLGAKAYFVKPDSLPKAVMTMRAVTNFWLLAARPPKTKAA
jgi:CheY-like chemotaxis protein